MASKDEVKCDVFSVISHSQRHRDRVPRRFGYKLVTKKASRRIIFKLVRYQFQIFALSTQTTSEVEVMMAGRLVISKPGNPDLQGTTHKHFSTLRWKVNTFFLIECGCQSWSVTAGAMGGKKHVNVLQAAVTAQNRLSCPWPTQTTHKAERVATCHRTRFLAAAEQEPKRLVTRHVPVASLAAWSPTHGLHVAPTQTTRNNVLLCSVYVVHEKF